MLNHLFFKKVGIITLLIILYVPIGFSGSEKITDADYIDKSKTIQFNVSSLLNARVVTTLSNGNLITWNKGIDGTWSGLATRTAADSMGSKDKIAFPNNGIFSANKFHPLVKLNFSNADISGSQVRFTDKKVADTYSFNVTKNCYSNISLFFMSAFGTSDLTIEISYSDKTSEIKKYSIEDWATKFPETETKYFLSANLAKWGDKNTELEKDSHYLMGINIKPDNAKRVVKITINKPASESTLTFWGATGFGSPSFTWAILGNSPEISYEGRTVETASGAVKLGFPGIVTRLNFRGTALSMHTITTSDELFLDVVVNGNSPVFVKVPKGENSVTLIQGLKLGEHSVAIFKRIECYVGLLEIQSFTVTGEFLPSTKLPVRKLIFIGDSFTAGQATTVEDGGSMDPNKAMRQNARLCYGRLLADKLNAGRFSIFT